MTTPGTDDSDQPEEFTFEHSQNYPGSTYYDTHENSTTQPEDYAAQSAALGAEDTQFLDHTFVQDETEGSLDDN